MRVRGEAARELREEGLESRLLLIGATRDHVELKRRAIKASRRDNRPGIIQADLQFALHILQHDFAGGPCQCHQRGDTVMTATEFTRHPAQIEVGGAEVVTPLGDAVRFVHRYQRDWDGLGQSPQCVAEGHRLEPLWGNVGEQVLASGKRRQNPLAFFLGADLAADAGAAVNAHSVEVVQLIVDQ